MHKIFDEIFVGISGIGVIIFFILCAVVFFSLIAIIAAVYVPCYAVYSMYNWIRRLLK